MKILKSLRKIKDDKLFNKYEKNIIYERRILENCLSEDLETVENEENKNKTYKGIVFKNIQFYNCKFEDCHFIDVRFINCTFIGCSLISTNFIECYDFDDGHYDCSLSFMKCIFSLSNFKDCQFPMIFTCDCLFYIQNFININFSDAQFERNAYYRTRFYGNCILYNVLFNRIINWFDIQFINDTSYVKMNSKTKIEPFDEKDDLYEEEFSEMIENKYTKISDTYRNFSKQLKMNDEGDREGELLYIAREFKSKGTKGLTRILYKFAKISCGYGEKWERSVLFSLSLILIFALLYMFIGIEVTNTRLLSDDIGLKSTHLINYYFLNFNGPNTLIQFIKDFTVSVYFSTMTFTTVGYGNITTINYLGMIISAIEMFVGASMMSVMIGTILRRLTR